MQVTWKSHDTRANEKQYKTAIYNNKHRVILIIIIIIIIITNNYNTQTWEKREWEENIKSFSATGTPTDWGFRQIRRRASLGVWGRRRTAKVFGWARGSERGWWWRGSETWWGLIDYFVSPNKDPMFVLTLKVSDALDCTVVLTFGNEEMSWYCLNNCMFFSVSNFSCLFLMFSFV